MRMSRRGDCLGGVDGERDDVDGAAGFIIDPLLGEQLQSELEVAGSLVGSSHGHGVVARFDAGQHRRRHIVGQPGMTSQLGGGAFDVMRTQRGGVCTVEAHPFTR
jgi:hypothetical protein